MTWTQQTSAGSGYWISVASSGDGTELVAVQTNSGYIYTSTDSGVTWTQRSSAGAGDWYSVASSIDGTQLVAVRTDGGYIYSSTDSGVTWATVLSSISYRFVLGY